MAQYKILARKLLGPPGTGPKQTLEDKNSVATPPQDRRTAAARRRPPPAQRAAHCRTLHAARPVMSTIAAGSYSAAAAVDLLIRSTTGNRTPSSVCTRGADEFYTNIISSLTGSEQVLSREHRRRAAARRTADGARAVGGRERVRRGGAAIARV
ncbi:hypothetical protein F511_13984 [Dorcoceras hygrometricum]|uniref:Uncharacterized protein n=1 Tax=Dorcoceras hygrometricum TaxID=472368 RepID=A0A2Z7ABF8_9LAMI|nr:hypothetical protein F511_13984 [Dorcoceras hygrometricum]